MSEPAAKIDAPPKVTPLPKKAFLPTGKLQLIEYVHKTHVASIPSGTPAEAVAAFDYLKHHIAALDDGDEIRAEWEDGTREIWFRVLYKSPTGLKLSKLLDVEHEAVSVMPDDAFKIEHKGHGRKWCVIRTDDNLVLKEGLPSRGEATLFLANYMKGMR